ncbi:hypothetical protein PENTCL1PPCAC_16995, partial [Pristionchus entomophagus]
MPVIAQIRNNLLFDAQKEYNCSLADSSHSVDWSTRGTARPIFGGLCIAACLAGIIPYIVCLRIIWEMRKHACYKMMFFLAMVDICTLMGNTYAGAAFMWGEMYCHHPRLNYLVNAIPVASFYSSCCTCLMIAINRFIELTNIRTLLHLYKDNRPWFWMAIPLAYGIIPVLCTPIAMLNSEMHFFMVDPGFSNQYEYTSYFMTFNNSCFPLASALLYVIMTLNVYAKRKQADFELAQDSVYRAALMLSAQCGVIVIVHMSTCVGYALLQFMDSPDGLRYALHFGWILIHATPPYVYLLFNRAIRRGLVQMTIPVQSLTHLSVWKSQVTMSREMLIAQLRNNLLFDAQIEYNCSLVDEEVDWSTRGTRRPIFGLLCMISGLLGVIPYCICLWIMWGMRKNPCYKMMIYLGVNDVLLLFCICFFAGAVFATGEVYCHNPKVHFSVCMFAFVCFFSSCSTCFLIAFNRFADMLNIRWIFEVIRGHRTWYWMIAPTIYGLFAALFTPIAFFNSDLHIVHFNPMISDRYEYANVTHATNNILFPTASCILYAVMISRMMLEKNNVS